MSIISEYWQRFQVSLFPHQGNRIIIEFSNYQQLITAFEILVLISKKSVF